MFLVLAAAFLFSCGSSNSDAPATPGDSIVQTDTPVRTAPLAPPAEEDTVKENPTDPIASIREHVTGINTATLQKKGFEFVCDEKMTVDYFYRDGQIVKIAIDFGTVGDVYAKEEYYYKDGQLLFFYEFVEGGPACEGCITTHEYRSYIRDGKVFRHLKDDKAAPCRKCTFNNNSNPYRLLKATTTDEVKSIFCK